MAEPTLKVVITADGKQYTATIDKATGKTKQLGDESKNSAAKINQLKGAVKLITASFAGFQAARLVKDIITIGAAFQQSMANVASVAGASTEQLAQLTAAAREQAKVSVFSASEVAQAQYFLASAGFEVNQIISAQAGVMNLAAATQSDLSNTSDIMTASLAQFGLEAEDSTRVANVYAAAISGSQANMQKLGDAMRYVGPIANSLDEDIESTTAVLSLLFNAGFKGEQAGTGLRAALVSLSKPSKEAAALIEDLKLKIYDANGQFVGFESIIRQLEKSQLDLNKAATLFGSEAAPQMISLVKKGADAYVEMRNKITDTNKAMDMANQQTDTLTGDWKLFKSAAEEAALVIFEDLEPALRLLTQAQTALLQAAAHRLPEQMTAAQLSVLPKEQLQALFEKTKQDYEDLMADVYNLDAGDFSHLETLEKTLNTIEDALELQGGTSTGDKLKDKLKKTGDQAETTSTQIKKLTKEQQTLLDSLDPDDKAFRKYSETLNELHKLFKSGLIPDQEKYQELVDAATEKFLDLGDETDNMVDKNNRLRGSIDDVADEYDKATKRMTDAIQGWGREATDAMTGFAFGARLSINSLLESLARDVLAARLHSTVTQPLLAIGESLLGSLFGNVHASFTYGTNLFSQQSSMLAAQDNFSNFGTGGVMTARGPRKLNRYGRGGIVNTPQLYEAGENFTEEAIVPLPDGRSIPVSFMGGGGPKELRVVIENSGTPQQIDNAQLRFDPEAMVVNVVTKDLRRGGQIASQFTSTFGVQRSGG